jgi:hypothetical protein
MVVKVFVVSALSFESGVTGGKIVDEETDADLPVDPSSVGTNLDAAEWLVRLSFLRRTKGRGGGMLILKNELAHISKGQMHGHGEDDDDDSASSSLVLALCRLRRCSDRRAHLRNRCRRLGHTSKEVKPLLL